MEGRDCKEHVWQLSMALNELNAAGLMSFIAGQGGSCQGGIAKPLAVFTRPGRWVRHPRPGEGPT